ncbi:MAG: cytochrome c peroxidase [Planctomycetaceae bacterium]
MTDANLSPQSAEKAAGLRSRLIEGLKPDQLRAARKLSRAFSPFKEDVEAELESGTNDETTLNQNSTPPAPPGQGTLKKREERLPNAPTVINSATNDRLFHDGRASGVFNGYDHLGDEAGRDGYGKWTYRNGRWRRVLVRIPDAALASQATAPLLSAAEMSWFGRQYHHVAAKLLDRTPLKFQSVSETDSHLKDYAAKGGNGLSVTYADLIRKAFRKEWWAADYENKRLTVEEGDALTGQRPELRQMEANFSLFWGIALMAYQQELMSSNTEFDHLMDKRRRGESLYPKGTSAAERKRIQEVLKGYRTFQEHACADCHRAPEFAGATRATVYGPILEFEGPLDAVNAETEQNEFANWLAAGQPGIDARIERMLFRPDQAPRFYDSGFYNIGVTPDDPTNSAFDPGVAGDVRIDLSADSQGALLSISQRFGQGLVSDLLLRKPFLTHSLARRHNDHWSSTVGSFKTPTMRNVALTPPYFHNGDEATLELVLNHYQTAGQETPVNSNLHPALMPTAGEPAETNVPPSLRPALLAFLNALTDERVRTSEAPFDHPSLNIPVNAAVDESSGRTPASNMKPAVDF